jgi:pimeloyl-ACP methyl ester carboxylesterase
MKRVIFSVFLFVFTSLTTLAQTEEPMLLVSDALTLDGTLTLPANTTGPVPVVLLIAGSGPTDRDGNSPVPVGTLGTLKAASFRMLSDSLVKQGIAVLRYDKRFSGKSIDVTAKEIDLRFETYIADAAGYIKELKNDPRFSRVVVVGHSEGALIGMIAARQAEADAFVSLAGPGEDIANKLRAQLGPQLPEADRQEVFAALDTLRSGITLGRLPTKIPSVQQLFRPSVQLYMISWMRYDPTDQIELLNVPVLIIQGKRDLQVTVTDAEKLKAERPNDKMILFENMTHVLKDVTSDDQLANLQTYVNTDLPLTPGLATAIAQFVKQ